MSRFSVFVLSACALLIAAFAAACSATTPTGVPTTAPVATSLPAQGTTAPASTTGSTGIVTETPSNNDSAPTAASAPAFTRINLNTATAEQILTIPNTGNRMVREFQEYRPYTTILQFRKEIGKYVDQATVAGYEQYVYVPIEINQADAATLQQIPGLTADVAAQLIAGRPYADAGAFLAKLTSLASGIDAATAQPYLAQ